MTELEKIKKDLRNFSNEVYNELGIGHYETVYHKALLVELRNANYDYDSEVITPIYYKDHFVGNGRADIVIRYHDKGTKKIFIIELKALSSKSNKDFRQVQSYMNSLGGEHGMMINFPQNSNAEECEIHDVVKTIRIDLETGKIY